MGKTLRVLKDDRWAHDALQDAHISMELIIFQDGTFKDFQLVGNKLSPAEAITEKKGKARLLLDKPEEVLCFGGEVSKKKHQLFLNKLHEYRGLPGISSVLAFYDNKAVGLDSALERFHEIASTDDKKLNAKKFGNIGFRIQGEPIRVHENPEILKVIIEKYKSLQREQLSNNAKKCSICGESDYPVEDIPHGRIKNVPAGMFSGCALVSYNENAFESYNLKGNNNSSICTNCAKTYVEGLNWLLSAGNEVLVFDRKGKGKNKFCFSNRKNFGPDTATVYWTQSNKLFDEINLLEKPTSLDIDQMIQSLPLENENIGRYNDPEQFFSCTLSGAISRIAIRDWIGTNLGESRISIARWFRDIAISMYDNDEKKMIVHYTPLHDLARTCQRKNIDGSYDKADTTTARVASVLWRVALQYNSIPFWILAKTLQRARLDKYGITPERAALIRLILNRHNKGGDFVITENEIIGNRPIAYMCGQIFSKLESIQFAALGYRKAGIREKYFTYAMTSPLSAFGQLFNLNSKHFTKLKSEKPGLAITLSKELEVLCRDIDINKFPQLFLLEEQGQFAIGYYQQKQEQSVRKSHA